MKIEDFFKAVNDHEDLEGLDIKQDASNPIFAVRHKQSKMITHAPLQDIESNDWEKLEPILTNADDLNPLFHMTRVVGYYSRTENWNNSKIGELKDRHKGNYALA